MPKFIQLIPTPDRYIDVLEFLEDYSEAFHDDFGQYFKLMSGYSFNGWHKIKINSDATIVLTDVDGATLTSFRPLVTKGERATKYYFNYGNSHSISTTTLDSTNFIGFHKLPKGAEITLCSVTAGVSVMSCVRKVVEGEMILPI